MISIIIPTLNEEKYIGKTLAYISRYSDPHEIIISDTHSKDKTVEIARPYTDKIIVHSNKDTKLTIAAGRNLGALRAQGEYLVFLDAEICIIDPDSFFTKAFECFLKDEKLIGLTGQLHVFNELKTMGDRIFIPFFIYLRLFANNVLGIGATTGEFLMVKRDAFEKVGGFNELLVTGEDDDFFRRLSRIGKTRLEMKLVAYHSNRRAHALGWPKLLWIWTKETLSIFLFGKPLSTEEWKEVR